jgi:hypothetical protein
MTDRTEDFLWKVHSYTNDYIRFADTKAAVVIAWASALVSGLYGLKAHHFLAPAKFDTADPALWPTLQGGLAATAFLFLGLAFVMAMAVVMPRLWTKKTTGFIFWEDILGHVSGTALLNDLERSQETKKHLADHLFQIAQISRRKYRRLRWAIGFSLVGGVAAAFLAPVIA